MKHKVIFGVAYSHVSGCGHKYDMAMIRTLYKLSTRTLRVCDITFYYRVISSTPVTLKISVQ